MNYTFFFSRLLVGSLLLVFSASFAFGANRLSPDEIQALTDIGKTLGKNWNFSVDPCSGELGWSSSALDDRNMNKVTCGNCSTSSTTTADQICHVTHIVIQASGFTGPIPSGISLLTRLKDLRITDLNGSEPSFPVLDNMKSLETLVLRNCNISGRLPEYLGNMLTLRILDLSFNKLTGDIPSNFAGLDLKTMFLTGNMLTGTIPVDWMKADSMMFHPSSTMGKLSKDEKKINYDAKLYQLLEDYG